MARHRFLSAFIGTLLSAFAPVSASDMAETVSTARGDLLPVQQADFRRGADGLFHVQALLNGHVVDFVLDTGASFVVLTEADARRIGIAPDESGYNASIQTAGGNAAMAWTTIDQVRLAGRNVRNVRAIVTRSGSPMSLLGQNMLSQLNSVTIIGDRVSLR